LSDVPTCNRLLCPACLRARAPIWTCQVPSNLPNHLY
jgi:hypothetical protein